MLNKYISYTNNFYEKNFSLLYDSIYESPISDYIKLQKSLRFDYDNVKTTLTHTNTERHLAKSIKSQLGNDSQLNDFMFLHYQNMLSINIMLG